jgi:hypothetical protein
VGATYGGVNEGQTLRRPSLWAGMGGLGTRFAPPVPIGAVLLGGEEPVSNVTGGAVARAWLD